MKRYVLLTGLAVLSLLLLLLWSRNGRDVGTPENSEPPQQTVAAVGESSNQSDRAATESDPSPAGAEPVTVATNQDSEFIQAVRRAGEAANVPVSFFGLVVDQDSNALQNVTVDLVVKEVWSKHLPEHKNKTTSLQRQTDAEGRFEVSGLNGRYVAVSMLTKAGFEEEFPAQGQWLRTYGAQSGSVNEPTVLRMWSTNIPHEKLVTGEKWSKVVPDGRPYGVDLTNAVIAEGTNGDLVVWIKRSASVGFGERYPWSCELTASGGLLEQNRDPAMCIAPATGYTNGFAYGEEAGMDGWSGGFYGKRFYIRMRDGQTYGRITFHLRASPSREGPAMVGFEYAINPSGSRLLR